MLNIISVIFRLTSNNTVINPQRIKKFEIKIIAGDRPLLIKKAISEVKSLIILPVFFDLKKFYVLLKIFFVNFF